MSIDAEPRAPGDEREEIHRRLVWVRDDIARLEQTIGTSYATREHSEAATRLLEMRRWITALEAAEDRILALEAARATSPELAAAAPEPAAEPETAAETVARTEPTGRGPLLAIVLMLTFAVGFVAGRTTGGASDVVGGPRATPVVAALAPTPAPSPTAIALASATPTRVPATATAIATVPPPPTLAAEPTAEPDVAEPDTESAEAEAPAGAPPAEVVTVQPLVEPAVRGATIRAPDGFNSVIVRSSPSTSAPNLRLLLNGTRVDVLVGAVVADGFRWTRVRTSDGMVGWVVTLALV